MQGLFIETNVTNTSFHLVKYGNLTKTLYILSTVTQLGGNLSKVVFSKVGWSDTW